MKVKPNPFKIGDMVIDTNTKRTGFIKSINDNEGGGEHEMEVVTCENESETWDCYRFYLRHTANYSCPDCGFPLQYSYRVRDERTDEERLIYYCPNGDEEYYFEEVERDGDRYLYAVCLFDGCRTCMGLA